MPLTYQSTVNHTKTTTKTVKAFDDWSMYDDAGNQKLKELAENVLTKMESLQREEHVTWWRRERKAEEVILEMLVEWHRLSRSSDFSEAGDTAVRERVAHFVQMTLEAVIGTHRYDARWDMLNDEAFQRYQETL